MSIALCSLIFIAALLAYLAVSAYMNELLEYGIFIGWVDTRTGEGRNRLGVLLMELRDYFRIQEKWKFINELINEKCEIYTQR